MKRLLKQIAVLTDVNNPESVKKLIAEMKTKTGEALNPSTKKKIVSIYQEYLNFQQISWERPTYKRVDKIPFIPTEKEVDILIASIGHKLQPILQLLKETGIRIGEAMMLKWSAIDEERKTVTITPEKGSNARILPISKMLIAMLHRFKRLDEYILPRSLQSIRTNFCHQRKEIALTQQNPRIKKIGFHTLRHFKATMEYHNTKDIIHVKYVLGHKSVMNTMIYINIEQALFLAENDEWITLVIHNLEEEAKAIEANFQLVRSVNETTAIYKKRK